MAIDTTSRPSLRRTSGTDLEKQHKVEALVRILCVAKGLTLANGGTPYAVCCEYSVTLSDGTPVEPSFDHRGLQFNDAYSLQTIPDPDIGIWKNSQRSFVNEWDGGTRAVVSVPVGQLSAAHLERIRGILRLEPGGRPTRAQAALLQGLMPAHPRHDAQRDQSLASVPRVQQGLL